MSLHQSRWGCQHDESVRCNVAQVRREHEEVRKRRLDEFMAGFNCISLRLKEMYQMITLGGDAELELVDSLDPFSEVPPHPFVPFHNMPFAFSSLCQLELVAMVSLVLAQPVCVC